MRRRRSVAPSADCFLRLARLRLIPILNRTFGLRPQSAVRDGLLRCRSMPASVKGFGRRPLRTVWACAGAGARKPPKEETAGRLGPFFERDYGDLRIADRWRGRRRQPGCSVFSAEAARAAVSDGDDAREPSVRIGRGKTGERVRTLRSCSGARLEAEAIGAARRDAWRRS